MKCKVIGIMSFKGGVGKTVSTINLAAALKKHGERVLVVDGNFLSPSLHFYLGLLRPKNTLKEAIRGDIAPEDAIYEHNSGIHLMPCNFLKNIPFDKFKNVIDHLREKYDYIIVDSGPSYTEEVIAILMVSDDMIFVATPDYPTLAATVKAAKLMKYKHINTLGVIVNRRKGKRFELSKKDIESTAGLKVIAEIREDNKMMQSVLKFSPVVSLYKRSKSAKAYVKLAKKILMVD